MRPSTSCICGHLNPIKTNTRFIILMHPKEQRKIKNGTGLMTHLQLINSEVIIGVDFTHDKRVNEILADENSSSFLLYPGEESFNLSEKEKQEIKSFVGKTATIFILDGTWPFARKMLKLSKNLQQLQRVSFDNEIKSKFIIKQQPESLCLSTIESVYTMLNLLGNSGIESSKTDDFLLPFEKMIEFQVASILNPNNNSYRPSKKTSIPSKETYNRRTQRNIIFEERTAQKNKTNDKNSLPIQ